MAELPAAAGSMTVNFPTIMIRVSPRRLTGASVEP